MVLTEMKERNDSENERAEQVYALYGHEAYMVAYGILKSPEDAEEIVNDVLFFCLRSSELPRDINQWRGYVFKVVKHRAIDRYRRRNIISKHRHALPIDAIALPDLGQDTERHVLTEEWEESVRNEVSQLPPKYRSAIQEYYLSNQDQSYDQAARRLGVPVPSLRSRLHRGKNKLRENPGIQELAQK
jgi:RNA polymerase sigma-70 factor (ECF subfamily)